MGAVYVDESAGLDSNTGLSEASAVKTPAKGVEITKTLLSSATENTSLLFKKEQKHNITAVQQFTHSDNRASDGDLFTIGSYGPGKRAILTAREAVTGWTADPLRAFVAEAPFSGVTNDLFWDEDFHLTKAKWGDNNTYYRIYQWSEYNKTVLIADSLVPRVASYVGMEMVIQMGWNWSRLPVASIVASEFPGLSRVYFTPEAASAEFAKGDLNNPGLGTPFAYGPYHNDSGQQFFWSGRKEFIYREGDWAYDQEEDKMYFYPPLGTDFATMDVYVPNGSEGFKFIGLDDYAAPDKLIGLRMNELEFRHFGYVPANPAEGHVGYAAGTGLYDNAGTLAFRYVDKVLEFRNTQDCEIDNVIFQEMSQVPIYGLSGNDEVKITRTRGKHCASGGINFIGSAVGTGFTFDTMPEAAQNKNVYIGETIWEDIGEYYLGSAVFMGAMRGAVLEKTSIKNCTDSGVDIGYGARWYGNWLRDMVVRHCDIDNVLTVKVDGAGIYSNGNICGFVPNSSQISVGVGRKSVRIHSNRIRNVNASGMDPQGSVAVAIYYDLGSNYALAYANDIENCDYDFKTNCAGYCAFFSNKTETMGSKDFHQFAGANIGEFNGGGFTGVLPPLTSPPSATDLAKFYGSADYAPFQFFYPFPTPESVIRADGSYNTLSLMYDNGPYHTFALSKAGASEETKLLLAD